MRNNKATTTTMSMLNKNVNPIDWCFYIHWVYELRHRLRKTETFKSS